MARSLPRIISRLLGQGLYQPPGRWVLAASMALSVVCMTGCGSQRPYPVEGRIVFEDGQPAKALAGGTVTFTSDELKVSASGDISKNGSFRLTMHRKDDGVLPGKYRVTVVPPEPEISDKGRLQQLPQIIDASYANPKTSELECSVEAKKNEVTLRVRRYKAPPR